MSSWHRKIAKCFCVPQRYILLIMLFFAHFNTQTHITLLPIAITEMIAQPLRNMSLMNGTLICNTYVEPAVQASKLWYDVDEETQGTILSSFYWGFIVTSLLAGFFANELGKNVFGLGVLGSTLCTLTVPFLVFLEGEKWVTLSACRVFAGFFEGLVSPAMSSIYRKWIPIKDQKLSLSKIRKSAAVLGTITSFLLGGFVMKVTEIWSSIFYLFGTFGIVWFCLWQVLCYSSPQDHPFVSTKEKRYLKDNIEPRVQQQFKRIPWRKVLSSVPFWMLIVTEIGHNWGWYLMVTNLPKYMKDILKFEIGEIAVWSSLPFACYGLMLAILGFTSNFVIKEQIVGTGVIRKGYSVIGSGFFMLLASYTNCEKREAMTWFSVAMGFMSTYSASVKDTVWDISPTYGGALTEMIDACGVLSGMMVPYVVGFIATNRTLDQWRYIFWISFYVYITVGFTFCIFGSTDLEPWDPINK